MQPVTRHGLLSAASLAAAVLLVILAAAQAQAYGDLYPNEVNAMIENGTDAIILDVREESEFCWDNGGHLPCALNYPWNSGVLVNNYESLDPDQTYIVVCRSGNRSREASAFLEEHGFTSIFNMVSGMKGWEWTAYTCDEPDDCPTRCETGCNQVTFPHVAVDDGWATEICVLNTSTTEPFTGTLKGYCPAGNLTATLPVNLAPGGRLAINPATAFPGALLASMVCEFSSGTATGYTKFWIDGQYRVGVPAKPSGTGDLYVPHIASNDIWWTGIALVNTGETDASPVVHFSDGTSLTLMISARGQTVFSIAGLFGGQPQPEITSATITNATGIVGLELFGGRTQPMLSGVSLSPNTSTSLTIPHVAQDNIWWTGIVACNPTQQVADLTLACHDDQNHALGTRQVSIPAGARMVGTADDLDVPEGTTWFTVSSSAPLTGFELFGTTNGQQLAGYSVLNLSSANGIFPKLDPNGWTGIALVNPSDTSIDVTLEARNDAGSTLATTSKTLAAGAKLVTVAENLFGQDISQATSLRYHATGSLVGFQLNGSNDSTMLDALPALH